jgi:hypothetical protein
VQRGFTPAPGLINPAALEAPRNFDVQGPESASLGFAITQPGLIQINVQWQGPPLVVELRGPNRLSQAGLGQMQLAYQVTPSDVQKGIFWQVALRLQTPAPAQAIGMVNVQRPPVNDAMVQTQLQDDDARRRVRGAEPPPQPTVQTVAAFNNALQATFARFSKEQLDWRAFAERQYQTFGAQSAQKQVITRALPVESAAIAAPRPEITGLSAPGGAWPAQLWITGSGFGGAHVDNENERQVHFVMGGQDVRAQINGYWTDTKIAILIPKIERVAPGPASIYVLAQGVRSPNVTYQYTPVLGTRTWCMQAFPPGTTHDRGFDMLVSTWPSGSATPAICAGKPPTGGIRHENFNFLAGTKGTDQFLRDMSLINGWVIEDVILGTFHAQQAGAYVSSFNKGSNQLAFDVRWWTDAFVPFVQQSSVAYTFAVVIKGPADLPDGFVVR